jgi:hypothetical protein
MDVVEVGTTASGVTVCCDARAARADAIVVAGRVKPHTDFVGKIESGMLKMTAIGLGKAIGAAAYHAAFAQFGYEKIIREVGAVAFARLPIVAGVRELLAVLPFDELDLLVVDEMGKDLSGAGMDTNVTARAVDGRSQKSPRPVVRQLFVRDLTEHSNGNANGVGLADFCLQRLADKIDWQVTYFNALTAAHRFDDRFAGGARDAAHRRPLRRRRPVRRAGTQRK